MEFNENEQVGLAPLATEIVTVADAKSWAVIETDLDDAVLTSLIVTARQMIESYTSKDMVSKDRISFVGELEFDDTNYFAELEYPAKSSTVVVEVDGETLTVVDDYELVGINGRYIKFQTNHKDVTITYESKPLTSPSEIELAKSATKMLIEQIYDNRGNLEGDSDIMIMDNNVKKLLTPLKYIYM